jgi:hypothetical protein
MYTDSDRAFHSEKADQLLNPDSEVRENASPPRRGERREEAYRQWINAIRAVSATPSRQLRNPG